MGIEVNSKNYLTINEHEQQCEFWGEKQFCLCYKRKKQFEMRVSCSRLTLKTAFGTPNGRNIELFDAGCGTYNKPITVFIMNMLKWRKRNNSIAIRSNSLNLNYYVSNFQKVQLRFIIRSNLSTTNFLRSSAIKGFIWHSIISFREE